MPFARTDVEDSGSRRSRLAAASAPLKLLPAMTFIHPLNSCEAIAATVRWLAKVGRATAQSPESPLSSISRGLRSELRSDQSNPSDDGNHAEVGRVRLLWPELHHHGLGLEHVPGWKLVDDAYRPHAGEETEERISSIGVRRNAVYLLAAGYFHGRALDGPRIHERWWLGLPRPRLSLETE